MCGLGTNGLNKIFPFVTKKINKVQYLESIKAYFGYLTEKQRFPNNDEFKKLFIAIDFYSFKKMNTFLKG
ncbi:hypothetical protein TH0144_13790 [Helicobacter pylori]